jgi:hypothetical protein
VAAGIEEVFVEVVEITLELLFGAQEIRVQAIKRKMGDFFMFLLLLHAWPFTNKRNGTPKKTKSNICYLLLCFVSDYFSKLIKKKPVLQAS